MNPTSNPPPGPHSFFPDWTAQLASDNLLTPGLKAGYRQTLDSFLEFCRRRSVAPTVTQAREFVELTRLEKGPSPQRLQEWKDALNWFFRRAREEKVITGIPPLARDDLGRTEWEAAMINKLRQRHFAWRTEQTYRAWLWRFVHFLEPRPIQEAGGAEVRAFLSQLATELRVGPATQKQALNALVFYFREVAAKDLGEIGAFVRARKHVRVPVVLNREECDRLFEELEGTPRLMAELMFGSGLRLLELLRLRVKDVDLERGQLIVRGGKGDEDRVTMLPVRLEEKLRAHRERLRRLHAEDRARQLPGVWLPEALERDLHARHAQTGPGSEKSVGRVNH